MISTSEAKKLIAGEMDRLELPPHKLTARTIGFQDLARADCVFVRVHDWTPDPRATSLEVFARQFGFRVEFRGSGFVS